MTSVALMRAAAVCPAFSCISRAEPAVIIEMKVSVPNSLPTRYEQPPRIAALYLGPDCWAERGDQNTLANLANEELEQYDLAFQQARNDRAGGAHLVRRLGGRRPTPAKFREFLRFIVLH